MQLSSNPHPRSGLVTFISWTMIVLSALLMPISVIALLMILAGGHGASTFDPIGFFIVVILPAAFFISGIGLLLRRAWAWYAVLALLVFLIMVSGWELLTARAGASTYVSDSGVTTTVTTSGPGLESVLFLGISAALGGMLLRGRVRDEFGIAGMPALRAGNGGGQPAIQAAPPSQPQRNWKVGHLGRDRMYYEELRDGTWRRIEIDGEMLTGRAHHVIYFASPGQWSSYPEWARNRRDEIVARIKSEFHAPDYEYHEGDSGVPGGGMAPSAGRVRAAGNRLRATPKQKAALVGVVVLLLGMSIGLGGLVASGLRSGSTYFPAKRASQQRAVTRQDEPATYWASLAIYSAISLSFGGLALWLTREGLRRNP